MKQLLNKYKRISWWELTRFSPNKGKAFYSTKARPSRILPNLLNYIKNGYISYEIR